MKNLIRLLVLVGILATPQFLSAGCTHAPGDCVTTEAWDVVTCWYSDGTYTQTIYWCNGDITIRGRNGAVKHTIGAYVSSE